MANRKIRLITVMAVELIFACSQQEAVDQKEAPSTSSLVSLTLVDKKEPATTRGNKNNFSDLSSAAGFWDIQKELPEQLDSLQEKWEFCKALFPDNKANQIVCIKGELVRICQSLNTCDGDISTGDTDADGVCNNIDPDDDNDGWSDSDEVECGSDPLLASSVPTDGDGDTVPDCKDTSELIDDSFGIAGEFSLLSPLGIDGVLDAVTLPDGSIFLTGWLSNGADDDLLLMKLTPNGLLDMAFDGSGYMIRHNIAGGVGDDWGEFINIAPDGDLLISGHSVGSDGYTLGFLWKVSTDGVDDSTFGSSGTFLFDVGERLSNFRARYDGFTGDIFAVGVYSSIVHAFRIKADGSGLDGGFGFGGQVGLYPSRSIHPSLHAFPDGTLIVAGSCQAGGGYDACSWLIDTDGNLVTTYNNYNTANSTLVSYGREGLSNPSAELWMVNNTLVNDRNTATFVKLQSGTQATLFNNLFVGEGTAVSGGAIGQGDLQTNSPAFVDRAGFDYHLDAGSPAIDQGVDPGSANGRDLTPIWQYLAPNNRETRPKNGPLDIGAFEH